jgi:hypothetical protein
MRPLRFSINVTLDGCCDHRAIPADEDLHRHAVENLDQADALLFGRVTYKMMEAAFRSSRRTGAQAGGPWADVVRGAIDVCRFEAGEPAGVRLGGRWRCAMSREGSDRACSPSHPHHWMQLGQNLPQSLYHHQFRPDVIDQNAFSMTLAPQVHVR